jgi:predicted glycoside hydrolase/deacetylase ChbG (UPF0249 family)
MVFMSDSCRAAALAKDVGLETGLHLNFSLPFDGPTPSPRLLEFQRPIVAYLRRGKWPQVVYNPFLKQNFEYVYKAQFDEYCHLYNKTPDKIDGHNHMHLCMNMMVTRLCPVGQRMRRTFSFRPGEKPLINRLYRKWLDRRLLRYYSCADFFFSIEPIQDHTRLGNILSLAGSFDVELMVHPAYKDHYGFLMSPIYRTLISSVPLGTYRML